jgi:uroporphyrinogen decarboxylase
VRTVYEKAAEFILKAADLTLDEFGSRNCTARISAPLDSNDLISPGVFENFCLPYLKRVNKALMARGVGSFSVHICGNHEENMEGWVHLPWPPRTIFSIGEMDLNRWAEAFEHKHIIGGNISTTLLALGSHEDVFEAACRCIKQGKDLPGGYILMPSCTVPIFASPLNIHAMVKAAREFGSYR